MARGRKRTKHHPYEEQGARLEEIRCAWLDGEFANNQRNFALHIRVDPTRWSSYETGEHRIADEALRKLKNETGAGSDYVKFGDASSNGPALQKALAKYRAKSA